MIIERVRWISVDLSGWPVLFCFVHLCGVQKIEPTYHHDEQVFSVLTDA